MGRNLWYKVLGTLFVIVALVLWLLSIVVPETFGFFSLAWAGVVICGGLGLVILLNGCFQKNVSTIKKMKIWFGIALIVCAFLCLVSELAIQGSIGAKWDEGDNHKAGYKNYHERKAEEEKAEKEEGK